MYKHMHMCMHIYISVQGAAALQGFIFTVWGGIEQSDNYMNVFLG